MRAVAGIILAGGLGARIGGGKPLLPLGAGTLIDAVIAAAAPQAGRLALNVPSTDESLYRERYGARFDLLCDPFAQGTGPLVGIVEGLRWATTLDGVRWLATFPCDAPFLPRDLVARLAAAAEPGRPVAAEDAIGMQPLCALWPVGALALFRDGESMSCSVAGLLEDMRCVRCRFEDAQAFFNVNTREDLERAQEMLSLSRRGEGK